MEKLFDAYATDGSMCEERFKALVHEHCVTFGTHKDLWMQLSSDGKISKFDFLDMCFQPSFKVVMPKQEESWKFTLFQQAKSSPAGFRTMKTPAWRDT